MRPLYLSIPLGAALAANLWIQPEFVTSATVLPKDKASRVIVAREITIKEGAISGELVNKSGRTIRNVQLLIRYSWRWKNEFRPGENSPGDVVFYTVRKEIPPGGTVPFTYKPSAPLPSRPDGYFETTVSVAGFTEVIW